MTYGLGSDAVLDVLRELSLVGVLVLTLERLHVVGHMDAENVLSVHLGLELLLLVGVAREALDGVRDVEATVDGALQRAENLGASGGASQTNVQVGGERAWLAFDVLDVELGSVDVLGTSVHAVQLELLEQTARQQETRRVGRRVVGQSDLHAVAWQLMRVRGRKHDVTLDTSVQDLKKNNKNIIYY